MNPPGWPYTGRLDLEGHPTREQQERLGDFLTELHLLTVKYGVVIDTYVEPEERPAVRDARTGTVLGMQLSYFVKDPASPEVVVSYDFMGGSILDGSWPVETENGLVALRELDGRAELARKGVPPR